MRQCGLMAASCSLADDRTSGPLGSCRFQVSHADGFHVAQITPRRRFSRLFLPSFPAAFHLMTLYRISAIAAGIACDAIKNADGAQE